MPSQWMVSCVSNKRIISEMEHLVILASVVLLAWKHSATFSVFHSLTYTAVHMLTCRLWK